MALKSSKKKNENGESVGSAKKKFKFKWKWLIIAVIIAVVGYFALSYFSKGKTEAATNLSEAAATQGDITATISSTGTVEPIEQYEIISRVTGDVLYDNLAVGETVEKDQLLYQVDSTKVQNSIKKAELSIEKQKLSYNQTKNDYDKTLEKQTVTAPIGGIVTSLYIKNGDNITNGTKIADITDYANLILKIPFHQMNAKEYYVGQSAKIILEMTDEVIYGTVKSVPTGYYVNSSGLSVVDVEISFKNPGGIGEGETATAQIGSYACVNAAAIEYGGIKTVFAETNGEAIGLSLAKGDRISEGDVIIRLKNDSSSTETNLKSSELSLRDAELSLADQYESLEDYNIKSPISGTVLKKTVKKGDSLGTSANSSVLAVIADMSKLTFTMNIDELEIKKVSVGTEVKITADALPDASFTGYVDNISVLGTTTNGVTTYPVEVIIEDYGDLRPGMNVNADIVTDEVTNVIMVPVSAVTRGSLVLVTEEYANQINGISGTETGKPNGGENQNGAGALSGNSPQNQTPQGAAGGSGQRPQRAGGESGSTGEIPQRAGGGSGNSGFGDQNGANQGMTVSPQSGENNSGNTAAGGFGNIKAGSIVSMPDTPAGYKYIKVETGLSDGNFIEIKAGLTVNAKVFISIATSSVFDIFGGNNGMTMGPSGGMGGGNFSGGQRPQQFSGAQGNVTVVR